MKNRLVNNFERSEFSDEIYAVFGRAVTIATKFDTSCKHLAGMICLNFCIKSNPNFSNDQLVELIEKTQTKYKNLNEATQSIGFTTSISEILKNARESRNQLIHEATIGAESGFDDMEPARVNQILQDIESMAINIIKGNIIISTLISKLNNEPLPNHLLSLEHEKLQLKWIVERL